MHFHRFRLARDGHWWRGCASAAASDITLSFWLRLIARQFRRNLRLWLMLARTFYFFHFYAWRSFSLIHCRICLLDISFSTFLLHDAAVCESIFCHIDIFSSKFSLFDANAFDFKTFTRASQRITPLDISFWYYYDLFQLFDTLISHILMPPLSPHAAARHYSSS